MKLLKRSWRMILVVLLPGLLVACQQSQTYRYYTLHPKQLGNRILACRNLPQLQRLQSQQCLAAYQAAGTLRQLAEKLTQDQQAFGNDLLALQIQAAALKLSERTNRAQAEQLASLQFQIQVRLSVLRFLTVQ